MAATAKHFPGLGAATENTDFEAQTPAALEGANCATSTSAPYRAYIAAGGKLVMLSTAIYPALLDRAPPPSASRIVTGELRGRLGFRGVTITDSLGSAAVAEFGGQREVAVDGAAAGDDLLLFDDLPSALAGHEALVAQLHKGGLSRAPFLAAAGRVLRLRGELAAALSSAARGCDPERVRVEDAEAVAARVLGRVHRRVGLGDQRRVAHQLVDPEDARRRRSR